jgi:O-acetyl-ADP-ribose deacetylase (regulator of RNase III)
VNHCISVVEGDITQMGVDAIVNAANSSLSGGGGVDGAIHKAAGPELYEECRSLKGCATGEAKATRGYRLRARWIIHTVGPIWKDGARGEDEKLAQCYRNSLAVAGTLAIRTIAFPSISTGAYGFPIERAARIAIKETLRYLESNHTIEKVQFVCFGQKAYQCYVDALKELIG